MSNQNNSLIELLESQTHGNKKSRAHALQNNLNQMGNISMPENMTEVKMSSNNASKLFPQGKKHSVPAV
jgi:hypothetical protein